MNNYWEDRYKNGGNSGNGSRGNDREFKWNVISKHISILDNVIDVGCGDLAFMEGKNINNYTGIDLSPTIISKNKLSYPEWIFINKSADVNIPGLKGDIVFCNDMLFHILDEDVYLGIINNLIDYSNKFIFIFTWSKNPLKKWYNNKTMDNYQAYRDFENYYHIFESRGFNLVGQYQSTANKYGSMYVFKKV